MQMNVTFLKIPTDKTQTPVSYLQAWAGSWTKFYWETAPAKWTEWDLNPRPPDFKCSSLTTRLHCLHYRKLQGKASKQTHDDIVEIQLPNFVHLCILILINIRWSFMTSCFYFHRLSMIWVLCLYVLMAVRPNCMALQPNINFCFCYLHMQMQTLCRAVAISITTSYSTSVKIFYSGLTEVFIASPFCDQVHEGQVKRNHLSWICREPRWMSSLNRELS